jgi:hypothetical protein
LHEDIRNGAARPEHTAILRHDISNSCDFGKSLRELDQDRVHQSGDEPNRTLQKLAIPNPSGAWLRLPTYISD